MIDRRLAPEVLALEPFFLKRAKTVYLRNRLPVHILQTGSQPIIRLEFIFKGGTWYESKRGQSYIATKLLPEGTKEHSANQIAEAIALYGAFIEVHHGFEHSNLTFYLLEKHLESILPIVAEIIFAPSFSQLELDNLKSITTQTLKVNRQKTQFLASSEFKKTLFGSNHPYGSQYWEDDVNSIDRESVMAFASDNLTIGNLEVFVSGHFDEENLIKLLERYFDAPNALSLVEKDRRTYELSKNHSQPIFIQKDDAVQSSIRLGRKAINRNHNDFVAFTVLNELFGGFFGSRLMKNIREDKGFTYGIHSSVHPLLHDSYLVIGTDVKNENVGQTIEEINKEIYELQNKPVPEDELVVVKSYMIGRFINSINTPFSLMDKFKTLHFNGLDYNYYDRYVERLNDTTASKIMELAENHLGGPDFVQVVVGG